MELIPIIKYALTGISAITFLVVTFSYIMYKMKNANNMPGQEEAAPVINTPSNHFIPEVQPNVILQPVRVQRQAIPYVQERNFHHNRVSVKKPAQRFMVLNEQKEAVAVHEETRKQNNDYKFVHPYTNQSFNIYNSYSANSSEPLEKFGI